MLQLLSIASVASKRSVATSSKRTFGSLSNPSRIRCQ
uniref:Uncharacterized protein n=1 Tax=Anopheles albimanus TaxID=7167 RepID=A0A182FXX7_ANOAL